MRKKITGLIALLLCGAFMFSSCGSPDAGAKEPAGGTQDEGTGPSGDPSDDPEKNPDDDPDDTPDDEPAKAPVITAEDVTVQAGRFFDPLQGVSAQGADGEDLTPYLSVSGEADLAHAGVYSLTYSLTYDGKYATHVRNVTVMDNPLIGKEDPVFIYESEENFNIARGCDAFASSENGNAKASAAFDGDPSSRWESVHGVDEVSLTVDLGAYLPVEEVSILWEAAYATEFEILLSDDGLEYRGVVSVENFSYQNGVAAVYSVGDSARFVRIACHARATIYGYSVFECAVLGKKGTVIPAEKFPVLYDSETAAIQDEQSLVYDFGSVKRFDSMEISWKGGSPLSYTVSVSDDGRSYSAVTHSGNGFREGTISARYVKLTMHIRRFYMSAYRISRTLFRSGGAELGGVTVSGEGMEGHPASDALRDWGTWWESVHDLAPQTVDLGEVKEIGRIDLTWRGDDGGKGKYYDLQTSIDGSAYRTVYRQTHGGLREQSVYLYDSARYLRIVDYQNGDTLERQGGTRFMLEGMKVHSQYPNEEKIDYDVTLQFPETQTVEGENGSYVTGDVTFPSARLVTYLDESLRGKPIPSNDWWQSLLVNDKGHNLYLNPLVATFDDKGLWLTNPGDGYYSGGDPGNGSQTIDQDVHDLHIGFDGMTDGTEVRVTGYDDFSVSAAMTDRKGIDKLTVFLSQGALYGYFFFAEPDKAVISADSLLAVYDLSGNRIPDGGTHTGDGIIVCVRTHSGYVGGRQNGGNPEYEERFYVVNAPAETRFLCNRDGIRVLMEKGNYLSVGALSSVVTVSGNAVTEKDPHGAPNLEEAALLHAHGYAFIVGTRCDSTFDGTQNLVETAFRFKTWLVRDGFSAETYAAFLPHHYKNSENVLKDSYAYPTVHGDCRGHVGNLYTTEDRFYGIVPQFTEPADDNYSAETLLALLQTLYRSNGGEKPPEECNLINGDPYWQGKNLHPMAMAAIAADQLGAYDLRDGFLQKIRYILTDWFTFTKGNEPNGAYFYYDSEWGTLYYKNSEFGAGVNLADHHFTYGYFTLAAGVLCAYDPAFAAEYGDMIELLLRDYMNPSREDALFPYMRNFDPFAGHSWAGGYADNNAGNNQESAGEALNGWVGAYLYATAVGNEAYREAAICGFTTELSAIKQYWFNYGGDSFAEFYPYGGIGQLYGATNFMGTFFNGEPLYAYGIHMIPGEEFLTSYALDADERNSLKNVLDSMREEQARWDVSEDHKGIYGWQHIFIPMVAAYDADEAIAWYEDLVAQQGNIGNDGEQFNVYYIIHALKTLGVRTTEYWAEDGASATVYEKDGRYTALCWNPTGETQEFVFRSENGVAGRAAVPAHSLVSCDPTTATEHFYGYRNADTLSAGDHAAAENFSEEAGSLALENGYAEYLVSFGSGEQYRRLVIEGEGELSVTIDGAPLRLERTAAGFSSEAFSLTFKHTVRIAGSGKITSLKFETATLQRAEAHGTLTASSENGANKAGLAMDGSTGTRWESVHGKDGEWLLLTLDEAVTVYQLQIQWEAASAKEYKIYFSETGEPDSFTEVFHGTFTGRARTDTVTPSSPMRAKYIRIEGISRTTQYGYSIFEIGLFTL